MSTLSGDGREVTKGWYQCDYIEVKIIYTEINSIKEKTKNKLREKIQQMRVIVTKSIPTN